jgi:hypothetical protein
MVSTILMVIAEENNPCMLETYRKTKRRPDSRERSNEQLCVSCVYIGIRQMIGSWRGVAFIFPLNRWAYNGFFLYKYLCTKVLAMGP